MADLTGLIYSFNKILYDNIEVPYNIHINYLMSHDTRTLDDFDSWIEVDLLTLNTPRDVGGLTLQLTCFSKISIDPVKAIILDIANKITDKLGFSDYTTFPRYRFTNGDIGGQNGTLTLFFQNLADFDQTPDGLLNQLIIEYLVIASNICIEDDVNKTTMTQVIGENKFG